MATKAEVLELHRKHPKMPVSEIARRLSCKPEYVRATFYRNGLTVPDYSRRSPEQLIATAEKMERTAAGLRKRAAELAEALA